MRRRGVGVLLVAAVLFTGQPAQARFNWVEKLLVPIFVAVITAEFTAHRVAIERTVVEVARDRYVWLARWIDEVYWQRAYGTTCDLVVAGHAEALIRGNYARVTDDYVAEMTAQLERQCQS